MSYDYNIGFKKADLLKVGALLEKQPFGEVYVLFNDIQRQISEQENAKRDESAAALSRQQNEAIEAEIERRRQAGLQPHASETADTEIKGQPVEEQPAEAELPETLIEKGD